MPASPKLLENALGDEGVDLPDPVREMGAIHLARITNLTEAIERLAASLETASKTDEELRWLCTIPGIGPVTAGTVAAFAPDLATFNSGRNFAAWLGLVPRQRSTGGKTKLGGVSKMGQADIRKLLIVGAMSVIRWVVRKGGSPNRRLAALVARGGQDGRCRGAREQDGPHDLGHDHEERGSPDGVRRTFLRRGRITAWPRGRGERSTRSRRHGLRSSWQGHSALGLERTQLSEPM